MGKIEEQISPKYWTIYKKEVNRNCKNTITEMKK